MSMSESVEEMVERVMVPYWVKKGDGSAATGELASVLKREINIRDAAIRAECATENRPDLELLETARAALAAIINKNPPILAVKDQRERNLTQSRLAADAAWQYAPSVPRRREGGWGVIDDKMMERKAAAFDALIEALKRADLVTSKTVDSVITEHLLDKFVENSRLVNQNTALLEEVRCLRREIEVWNEVAVLPVPPTSPDDPLRVKLRQLALAQLASAEARDATDAALARAGVKMGGGE